MVNDRSCALYSNGKTRYLFTTERMEVTYSSYDFEP